LRCKDAVTGGREIGKRVSPQTTTTRRVTEKGWRSPWGEGKEIITSVAVAATSKISIYEKLACHGKN